jgi:hypothetical protein
MSSLFSRSERALRASRVSRRRAFFETLETRQVLATVFLDTFEGNSKLVGEFATQGDDASDPQDVAWYSSVADASASVQLDSFSGTGINALQLSANSPLQRLVANFANTTLGATPGDKLTLSFDMRLTETPSADDAGFRCHALRTSTVQSALRPGKWQLKIGYMPNRRATNLRVARLRDRSLGLLRIPCH